MEAFPLFEKDTDIVIGMHYDPVDFIRKYMLRWLERMELEGTPLPPGSYDVREKVGLLVFICDSSSIYISPLSHSLVSPCNSNEFQQVASLSLGAFNTILQAKNLWKAQLFFFSLELTQGDMAGSSGVVAQFLLMTRQRRQSTSLTFSCCLSSPNLILTQKSLSGGRHGLTQKK